MKFFCTWGEGYVKQESRVLDSSEITPEYGWTDEYIHMLSMSKIGDIVDCSDPCGVLYVKRIE